MVLINIVFDNGGFDMLPITRAAIVSGCPSEVLFRVDCLCVSFLFVLVAEDVS